MQNTQQQQQQQQHLISLFFSMLIPQDSRAHVTAMVIEDPFYEQAKHRVR